MKITVYTITDCQFSKQEKEYLASHNLQYEEKNLETNKDFLTEMLAVSNNFAGTPVTRIEKDDGSIIVLKGFTKSEFDEAFKLTTSPSDPTSETIDGQAPVTTEPQANVEPTPLPADLPAGENQTPQPPQNADQTNTPPVVDNDEPTATPPSPAVSESQIPDANDKLNAVLDKLEENEAPTPQVADVETATSDSDRVPTSPPPADAPSIPDFPADDTSTQPVK